MYCIGENIHLKIIYIYSEDKDSIINISDMILNIWELGKEELERELIFLQLKR